MKENPNGRRTKTTKGTRQAQRQRGQPNERWDLRCLRRFRCPTCIAVIFVSSFIFRQIFARFFALIVSYFVMSFFVEPLPFCQHLVSLYVVLMAAIVER